MDDPAANIITENVSVDLPINVLAQIDAQIGGGFVDRQDYIRSAVHHYLEYQESVMSQDKGAASG